MKLSIIIVNWNTKEFTSQCIKYLSDLYHEKFSSGEFELIVIDNASSDGSREYLSKLDWIKFILNESNSGYAPACNQGMRIANGEYILLLGSDTVMKIGCLEKCISFLDEHKNCTAVSCKLLNPDGTPQNSCKKFPNLKNAFFTYLSLHKFNYDYDMGWFGYDKTIQVEQPATTFFMCRSEILKQLNYFDERYRILYNDVDLCKRIYSNGGKIFFIHDAEILHHGSQSTRKAGFKLRKIMYSDIYRYYRNQFGFKAKFLYPILAARLLFVSSVK